MERFEVEGTTLVSWTIRVQAHDEREAVELGESIAAWIDIPSSLVTDKAAQHRIVRSGLIGSDDESTGSNPIMAVMPFRRLSDERAPKVPHDCTVHELAKDGDVMYCISHVRAFALLEEGSTFGPGPTLTTRSGTGHEAFAVGGRLVGPSPMRPQAGRRGPPLNEERLCLS